MHCIRTSHVDGDEMVVNPSYPYLSPSPHFFLLEMLVPHPLLLERNCLSHRAVDDS